MESKKEISKKRPRETKTNKDIEMKDDDESLSEYESVSDSEEIIDEGKDEDIDMEEDKPKNESKLVTVSIYDSKKEGNNKELDFDNNAYDMLHRSKVEWPCLSIDFLIHENFNLSNISDFYKKNESRVLTKDEYPYSTYMVAGSQTNEREGFLYLMKWFNMKKTKYDDDPDKDDGDDDESETINPYMKYQKIRTKGNINRIKSMKNSSICAMWTDCPSIEIVNVNNVLKDIEYQESITAENDDDEIITNKNTKKRKIQQKNITINSFQKDYEGFGLDWSNTTPGMLAVGGLDKKIEIYCSSNENMSSFSLINKSDSINTLKGHTDSVEDIQWSPSQDNVLASCSVDKSIRFWDLRANSKSTPIIIQNAHDSDVNVISWNNIVNYMLASGGDDNIFKVWDIRYVKDGPISNIKWHTAPINSLMWDPYEESQIAVCSEDDRLSIWDFSVEPDDKQLYDTYNQEIPQQLVFLHQGQTNLKDVKFHPYFKNLLCSTSENGINIFKPAFDLDSEDEEEKSDEDVEMK